MFARIFEYKFTNLDQAKIAANHCSMELGDKIDKFNIQSLSITIGKCASLSIVAKFENNSDLQQFEKYASNLIDQLRKREWRYTHQDQRKLYNIADMGLSRLDRILDKSLPWGRAQK